MINTFFGTEKLVAAPTPATFLAAFVIGLFFGIALEYAGFGSSRKLSGIFYFRDMTVLRVMFTALITCMLGLSIVAALGWIDLASQVYVLPSIYGAQIVGGLVFGVGFVMSGWCPGTGVVGVASGKMDAVVFLVGVVLGAIVFNETYGLTDSLRSEPVVEVAFGIAPGTFALLFTLAAIAAFYLSEFVEKAVAGGGRYLNSTVLRALSVCLVIAAVVVFILPTSSESGSGRAIISQLELDLLQTAAAGVDHVEPEELAAALMATEGQPLVIDVRPADEYESYHIPFAVNVQLPGLPEYLEQTQHKGRIVLYSNGMTHPAQARDALTRLGYQNVRILTDGLQGFIDRCLKPVSLRSESLTATEAEQVRVWRSFFLDSAGFEPPNQNAEQESEEDEVKFTENDAPRLVSTKWLDDHLRDDDLRVIDTRTHADYTLGHIPGAVFLHYESVRGPVGGMPSLLVPKDVLARQMSILGIKRHDMIVFAPGDSVRDATLISMALQRLGHERWAILHGGFPKWSAEHRPVEKAIPVIVATDYPVPEEEDAVTVDAQYIADRMNDGETVVLDTRPSEYFTGSKSREMRPGRIPGAINRVYKNDVNSIGDLRPVAELAAEYQKIIPSKDSPVIVYCRTGHQASLCFFVLKELLGYSNVKWYDASWTDWATRDLPAEEG